LWVFTKTTHKAAAENKQKATQQTVEITTETEGSHNANLPLPVQKWKTVIFPTTGNFLSQGNDI
jgi:hypothetical protein